MSIPVSIAKRLIAAQKAVEAVEKSSTNSFHKYKYASSEDVTETARKALLNAGLGVSRIGWDYVQAMTENDESFIRVTYAIFSEEGDSHVFPATATPAVPEKGRPADKAVAGALTLNQNYFLLGLLEIVREDENDVEKRNDSDHQPRRMQQRPPQQAMRTAQMKPEGGSVVLRGNFESCADPAELKLFIEKRKPTMVQMIAEGKDIRAAIAKHADRVGADPKDALGWFEAA
jgi:hypothetical protein